ncbi:F-box/WD repeat-containing protein 4 [Periplaneta americana]
MSLGRGEEKSLLLEDLPTEVLLVIFKYCTLKTLGNICQTCQRLNSVVNDFIWYGRSQKALVTNQISADIKNRSSHLLSAGTKCRIAYNWVRGRYSEKIYHPFKTKHLPWLVLERDRLWLSKGKYIRAFQRKSTGLVQSSSLFLKGHSDDVCRFVSVDGLIVSGGRDGSICGWSSDSGRLQFCHSGSHRADIVTVDMCNGIVVSGSHDKSVKVWGVSEQDVLCPRLSIDVGDRIWSIALRSQGDLCCVGSAGHQRIPPLHLFDMERGCEVVQLEHNTKAGAGMLDIHWESPNEFLSGGYDTYLGLWDVRTGCKQLTWEDPYDSVIYSLASDNMYTMFCGMALHGRVHLWDKRHRRTVGKYFMSARHSSPVYGVAFDPCNLFAVLDQSLHVLDFSVFKTTPGIRNCP